MKAIIVDDEQLMLKSFRRNTEGLEHFELVGAFDDGADAFDYVKSHRVDVAFLDIEMPGMNGLELAAALRCYNPRILLVFVTAYDNYVRESNDLSADYYIVKPYTRDTMEFVVNRLALILGKDTTAPAVHLYIQCFGRFTILKDGKPLPLVGKAKEILAYLVTRRGREVSNEELYSVLWEDRTFDNEHMKVYFNAVRRLRDNLQKEGLEELLVGTARGKMINTSMFDCDYNAWRDGRANKDEHFEGEFLSEYSWGEEILAELSGQG